MAGLDVKAQYVAVAQMRWRMLINSLRTRRGNFDFGTRIAMQALFSLIGIAIGAGLAVIAWQIATHGSLRLLAVLLWPVFAIWQFVPIAMASFQENADLSIFLRFPISFRSYVLFYILFGIFDASSLVGGIALFGIFVGASFARPALIPWLIPALILFAFFNILLTRMIFSWIDRWLAQRKTREILGVAFLFLVLGAQLLNPAFYRHHQTSHVISQAEMLNVFHTAVLVQNWLPPGLAANIVYSAPAGRPLAGGMEMALLAIYASLAGALLGIRLQAEYRGESLGEAPARMAKAVPAPQGKSLEVSGPVAAIMEKEIRYLMRSGVMLYGFLAPLIIVFLFSGESHRAMGHNIGEQYALPIGVAYSFLGLTRFVYNNLGGEGAGIQVYFLSPTPFRKVMLAKNLVHSLIFMIELALVCCIIAFRAGLPSSQMIAVTICWLLFAVPTQLAMGNILSVTMPYRLNMTRMSREQGAAANGMIGLVIEFMVFVVGAAVYLPLRRAGHAGWSAPVLLVFAAGGIFFWLRVLSQSSAMAQARRELLISTLYRTT